MAYARGQDELELDGPDHRPASANSRNAWDSGMPQGMDRETYSPSPTANSRVAIQPSKKTGVFGYFGRGVRSLWATRFTEETKTNRELYVKTTLRELIVYLVFLVIVCVVTFGMTSPTMFYYTKVMSDLFLDTTVDGTVGSFRGITNVEQFWVFAKDPMLKGLYWEKWYNNEKVSEYGYIYYENKILGLPRIRQLKVSSNSCVVPEDFKDTIRECYDTYATSLEDKETFGPVNDPLFDNYTAFKYAEEDTLDGSGHWGLLASYSGAGYVQDMPTTRMEAEETVDYLFQNRWIDRGTRAVFIDFSVYNANINLFCVIRLVVEFPATGGAIPSWVFRTVKLIRYVTVLDYFVMACECLFILFILYYIVEEILEIKKHKLKYFKSFWNIIDIVVIMIALLVIAFQVYRTMVVDEKLDQLLQNPNQYADFEFLAYWQTQFNNAMAVAVFFAWVKIFKYISFNKTMTQLSSTLARCAKDLAGFAVMFFIIFLAFAQLGYLIFGTQVKDFSTFPDAIFTLFRIILGDFNFHELEAAHRVLGPIYFILYVFFVFFVLLNMFLAIINDTYSEVKADISQQKNEFEMGDYFKRGYAKMMDKLNLKKDKIVDIQKALNSADINNDKQLDFDEWRNDLKSRGYADGEIEAMFAKYDHDGDRVLDEEEQKQLRSDLANQKDALNKEYDQLGGDNHRSGSAGHARRSSSRVSFTGDSGDDSDDEDSGTKSSRTGRTSSGVSYEEFTVLSRRVDRMEHSIGSIVSKIDAVLVKLEAMEKAKMKRRETMGKILDSITESDGTSDEMKRDQMEQLVREELERWDSETSVGQMSGSSGHATSARNKSRPSSGQNNTTDV